MSSFTASSKAVGSAQTSTTPAYKVTSSATATASSNLSQANAQEEADNTAQQVANSVAQNDANIISQTLNLIPISVIGANSFLNIAFAFKTSLNQCDFNGVIVSASEQTENNLIALTITANKQIYDATTLLPISNSKQLSTINVHATNYGGIYGTQILDGVVYSSPTPASVLSCNRDVSIDIPNNGYVYKAKILTNLKYFCNIPITPTTSLEQIKGSIQNFEINNKTILYVNIASENGSVLKSYVGVQLTEQYTPDYLWNYINFDFTYAYSTGSSLNIYPVSKPTIAK